MTGRPLDSIIQSNQFSGFGYISVHYWTLPKFVSYGLFLMWAKRELNWMFPSKLVKH